MLVIFLILGLIVGSFLNVVISRIRVSENFISGRSRCPHCRHNIRWYDNLPVLSFLMLGAKCRDCGEKISWQYLIVEVATGVLFFLTGLFFFDLNVVSSWWLTGFYLAVLSFFVVIFVYDYLYMEISQSVLVALGILAVAFWLYFDWTAFPAEVGVLGSKIYSGILASALAFLFFFSLVYFSKEKWMGLGDAYLALVLGLIVGFPQILMALVLAFTLGAIVSVALVALKSKGMKSRIPFGPFLVAGAAIVIFFYEPILKWYSSIVF